MPVSTSDPELHTAVIELARELNYAAFTTLLPSGYPQT